MKAEHLRKIAARAERVKQLLLPEAVMRGDVTDPQHRLRELIQRLGGREALGPGFPLRTAVADVVRFLETDIPEMIQAVRDAEEEAWQARRALSARAGTRYQVTITSDAPLAVSRPETVPADLEQLPDIPVVRRMDEFLDDPDSGSERGRPSGLQRTICRHCHQMIARLHPEALWLAARDAGSETGWQCPDRPHGDGPQLEHEPVETPIAEGGEER